MTDGRERLGLSSIRNFLIQIRARHGPLKWVKFQVMTGHGQNGPNGTVQWWLLPRHQMIRGQHGKVGRFSCYEKRTFSGVAPHLSTSNELRDKVLSWYHRHWDGFQVEFLTGIRFSHRCGIWPNSNFLWVGSDSRTTFLPKSARICCTGARRGMLTIDILLYPCCTCQHGVHKFDRTPLTVRDPSWTLCFLRRR